MPEEQLVRARRLGSCLELLRTRERALISKRLHDDLGPALCAAGLHIRLLEKELSSSESARESLESVESVLGEVIETIRGLSYRTDPTIFRRCGLHAALTRICQEFGAQLEVAGDLSSTEPSVAEAFLRIVLEALTESAVESPGAPAHVAASCNELRLHLPRRPDGRDLPSTETLEALRFLSEDTNIRFESHQQSGDLIACTAVWSMRS